MLHVMEQRQADLWSPRAMQRNTVFKKNIKIGCPPGVEVLSSSSGSRDLESAAVTWTWKGAEDSCPHSQIKQVCECMCVYICVCVCLCRKSM